MAKVAQRSAQFCSGVLTLDSTFSVVDQDSVTVKTLTHSKVEMACAFLLIVSKQCMLAEVLH